MGPEGFPAYHWQELWRALVLLLDFLASKLDSLVTTGGIEQLAQEVSSLKKPLPDKRTSRRCNPYAARP